MATGSATFKIEKEGTLYDWNEVIGGSEELYTPEEATAVKQAFEALPYEKKRSLFDNWATEFGGELQRTGQDLTKFNNYLEIERGFLAENYGDTDTFGEELAAGIGKTYEGIASRARFLGSPEILARATGQVPGLPPVNLFIPSEQNPFALDPQSGPIQGVSQVANAYADMAQQTGENLQGGTVERSGIFQPQNPRWWAEKGIPVIGGLLTDLGVSLATGPAAPLTFGLSAASQVGGDVLQESQAAYQKQAQDKYKARLESGMAVAEARTQLRGELAESEDKAATEAAVIASVSTLINSIPGAQFTSAVRNKALEVIARKGLGNRLKNVGISGLSEGIAEVMDEIAQDAGRLGRDIGDFAERWQQYKQSKPAERYLAAGTLGAVMGGAVDVALETSTAIAEQRLQQKVVEKTGEPPVSPEIPEGTPDTAAPDDPLSLLPPVPEGHVRFYHGGAPGEGARWVTPQFSYARDWRKGNPVQYVDVPRTSPFLRKAFDDSGTSMEAPYMAFEAPAEMMSSALLVPQPETPTEPAQVQEGVAISEETPIAEPIRDIAPVEDGEVVSYLEPDGSVISGQLTKRTESSIWIDGKRKAWRPDKFFRGLVQPKPNAQNMRMGDVLYDGASFYKFIGNQNRSRKVGQFIQGSRIGDEIIFDNTDLISHDLGFVNDPRVSLYEGQAFDAAVESFNARENPQPEDRFTSVLQEIGEKPYDQTGTVGASPEGQGVGPEVPGGARSEGSQESPGQETGSQEVAFNNTPPPEEESIRQLRDVLTRRAQLDRSRKGEAKILPEQIETLVNLIGASAEAIASRTGNNRSFILSRISFGHAVSRGRKRRAGEYDRESRMLNLMAASTPTTVVHEWGHYVLEEHIFNDDAALNILSPAERSALTDFIQARLPVNQGGVRARALTQGKPTDQMHEYFSGMLEKVFQQRYYEGNKPKGIPDNIFEILKKVGDFIRQVYSKLRYQNIAQDLTGSQQELDILNLIDRIFVPDQVEKFVNTGAPPSDVVLPANNIADAPSIDAMAANFSAASQSNTRDKVITSLYRQLDTWEADGKLGQEIPEEPQQQRLRKPMQALREFDRIIDDGIGDYATLALESRYAVRTRETTIRSARDLLGKMTTGEAIAYFMGDPYRGEGSPVGAVTPDVYMASVLILAKRLRQDLTLLPGLVSEGKLSPNESFEVSSLYEKFLKYVWETASPAAGRSVDIFNRLNEPTTTRARVDRLLGILGATESRLLARYQQQFGGDFYAKLRTIAERHAQGEMTDESKKRRQREAVADFESSMAPEFQRFGRKWASDARKLFQTLMEEPGAALPEATRATFGNTYWFSPQLWERLTQIMAVMDQQPANSMVRDLLHSEVVALLGSEAGIPFDRLLSAHFMAAYLCGPSTAGVSLMGNLLLMGAHVASLVTGGRLVPADIRSGVPVNPNIRYIPQMISRLTDVYGVGTNRNGIQRGAAWRNIELALRGFGPGTRFHQGRMSASETYRQTLRYRNPEGMVQNLGHIAENFYSLLVAMPYRAMSVADALVGSGSTAITGAVAASQTAQWNADRYERNLVQQGIDPQRRQRMKRAFFNAEFTRLQGYTPLQVAEAVQRATAQAQAISNTPALQGSKTQENIRMVQWALFQQEMENQRQQAFSAEQNAGPQETPDDILNAYQQEQEFVRALASFSYQPRGILGALVNVAEGLVNAFTWRVGRVGEQPVLDPQGNILGYEGGVNVGEIRPLRILLPFLRAAALGTAVTFQMTPWGFISMARGAPLGARRGSWNRAEYNAFSAMTLMGSLAFLAYAKEALDDDDPLEPDRWHVIGPLPARDRGRRMRDRGIKPYTKYRINSDGTIESVSLMNVQGLTTSPLILWGAYNSMRWAKDPLDPEQNFAQALFETGIVTGKVAFTMGPLGQMGRYGAEMKDDTVGEAAYSTIRNLTNVGIDGVMMYRRALNEVGALVNESGRAVGIDWEPEYKKVPATVQGEPALNAWRTLTNDYLFFDKSGRNMLNGYGEPMPEEGNPLRKYTSKVEMTPIQKLLSPHGLTLSPISRYRTNIRKGSDEDMKELFGAVTEDRASRLPRHLVGVLTDGELHEYMQDYYRPALETTLKVALRGDPYQREEVQATVEKYLSDPKYNDIDNRDRVIQKMALQEYINGVRSKIEEASMAKYFADKNPALDSVDVAGYLLDMQETLLEE